MMKRTAITLILIVSMFTLSNSQIQKDKFNTSKGELEIWFIGHASLMFTWQGMNIHVDPYTRMGDYAQLPKADIILLTHEHRDHLDTVAINVIRKANTKIVLAPVCFDIINEGTSIANNEELTVSGLLIESVPAYNVVHVRDNGQPFHPRGVGNGYILNFGDKRVYVAGDTEDIPEMQYITNIDIAFLPMNLPFTMTPEMTANAAKIIRPKILYPYHYGQTDTNLLVELLKDLKEIEVRIRKM
jgi:L-ascorbate metabolism protein UlaG (beta-lactamase superfamily)